MTRFKIVIPSYNSFMWLGETLESIEKQTHKNYEVCVIDDSSTQKGQRELISDFCSRNGWSSIFNSENKGALYNIVNGIKSLNCEDNDVIVLVDGDDWLYDEHVLAKLNKIYTEEEVSITYGQCVHYPGGGLGFPGPVAKEVIQQRSFRRSRVAFCHLKTFKHLLWRHIKDEDLRDDDGEYYLVTWDMALMYPMLEMAGDKIRFVPDILYVYNIENPINDHKIFKKRQKEAEYRIRQKTTYPTLGMMN